MDSVDYYNKYANFYFDNTVDLNMGETLDRFMEYFSEGDTILDLGCGSGRDGKAMMEKGMEVTFLDASKELCALANIYTGIEPLCMDYRDMDFDKVFQGVWACASLLHIPKKELSGVLSKISQALKPEGIFYMSVKKGDFEGFRKERFFADYSEAELMEILKEVPKLQVIDMWETKDIRRTRDESFINVLAQKNVDN